MNKAEELRQLGTELIEGKGFRPGELVMVHGHTSGGRGTIAERQHALDIEKARLDAQQAFAEFLLDTNIAVRKNPKTKIMTLGSRLQGYPSKYPDIPDTMCCGDDKRIALAKKETTFVCPEDHPWRYLVPMLEAEGFHTLIGGSITSLDERGERTADLYAVW